MRTPRRMIPRNAQNSHDFSNAMEHASMTKDVKHGILYIHLQLPALAVLYRERRHIRGGWRGGGGSVTRRLSPNSIPPNTNMWLTTVSTVRQRASKDRQLALELAFEAIRTADLAVKKSSQTRHGAIASLRRLFNSKIGNFAH
jgi:hypothetical protein